MKKIKAVLVRLDKDEKQTLGHLTFYDGIEKVLETKTMELPWKDNQRRISCIPTGVYNVDRHKSPKYGNCFWVKDVPDRSEILVHLGNYNRNTLGCILPGNRFIDIDNDGLKDVTSSRLTMKQILAVAPDGFELTIL